MKDHSELQSLLRSADPYPSSEPLSPTLTDEKAPVEQIMGFETPLLARPAGSRRWRGPLVAVGLGIAVLVVGLLAILLRGGEEAPPAEQGPPVEITVPERPLDPVFPVEPSGSGPALMWEVTGLPLRGTAPQWMVSDGELFYLSISGSSQLGPGVRWLSSSDGRTWEDVSPTAQLPTFQKDPNEPFTEVAVWNGVIIAAAYPDVYVLDTKSNRFESFRLQLPDDYTDPESWCEPDTTCQPDLTVAAGDRGAMVFSEGPDPHSLAAWYCDDGFDWSLMGELPGDPISLVAVDGGFMFTAPARGGCGVWFSEDSDTWAQIHTLTECPIHLEAWNSDAIALYPESLWRVSRSSVSPIVAESLSRLNGNPMMLAAGSGGIIVPYDVLDPEADPFAWGPLNAVVDYTPDGTTWSRRVLPETEIASSVSVAAVGTTGLILGEGKLLIGTPER